MQALEAAKTAKLKRVYYDFADYLRTNPTGNVPYTPSLPLLYGTKESISMMKEEGKGLGAGYPGGAGRWSECQGAGAGRKVVDMPS